MKLNRIAIAALLAAPLALPAHALVNVTPLIGMYQADEPQGVTVDDGFYAGLAAGLQFFPSWSVEAEYGEAADTKLLSGNVLISPTSWSMGKLAPYVLTGFSQSKVDYKIKGGGSADSDDTTVNLGGGLLYSLNDRMAIRGELRAVHNSDHSLTNYLALAGLQFSLGGAMPEAVERPAVAPRQPVMPMDTDGDGVVDANDRCPNTPAGWEVGVDGCPLDADKDKVPNSIDECPNTPLGMVVGANGCPMDDDKDGVGNGVDKCPGTAPSVVVDEVGCPKLVDKVIKDKVETKINIVFDVNSAVIKPQFEAEVAKISDLAKQYPTSFITIEGHTDSSGNPAKNLTLSKQRADAVRMMLINKFGVDEKRLMAVGYGQLKPVATNKTAEGKSLNRRVMAVLTGERTIVEKKVLTKPEPKKAKKAVKKGKGKAKAKKSSKK